MCGMVICLECLDLSPDSVANDMYVICMPRISIPQGIDKVTCVFQFAFVGTFGLVPDLIHYPALVQDGDLVVYYQSFCIIDTISSRR